MAIWQREEDREHRIREKEAREIAEAERIHQENIQRIREQAKKNLDSPPDPPSVTGSPAESTGKRLNVATFVTDLILNYDVKEYIRPDEQDESSTIKETSDDVHNSFLSSSGSDS